MRLFALLAFALLDPIACSSDRPSMLVEGSAGKAKDAGILFTQPSEDAGCSAAPGVCGCAEFSLAPDRPTLYFVLDRSGSMLEGGKWTQVRTVVTDVVTKIGPRAQFGLALLPRASANDSCIAGSQVISPRPGDIPAGTFGALAQYFQSAMSGDPSGGTPVAATLRAIRPLVAKIGKKTHVILASDGGPNCNLASSCSIDRCMANLESMTAECKPEGPLNCCDAAGPAGPGSCLDAADTLDAVKRLRDDGVKTHVIGVPGSGPYAALLDDLAFAGDTARTGSPKYYRVDDIAAFSKTMSEIAAQITATCVFPVSEAIDNPNRINVYLDNVLLPKDPKNGWTLSSEGGTSQVTLLGEGCEKVKRGDVLGVRLVGGCETVGAN